MLPDSFFTRKTPQDIIKLQTRNDGTHSALSTTSLSNYHHKGVLYILKTFEEQKALAARVNLMDDQFFHKVAEDLEVCEELLQILLNQPDLKVVENQTQRYLRNLGARSVILDVLCQDKTGAYFNIEVQKHDKHSAELRPDEYQKRVRCNLANIDTVFTEKGVEFRNLPDIYAIFLSEHDPFEQSCTTYHIHRAITETGTHVQNGIHEIYVNAEANDGSLHAELMNYMVNSNGYHPLFKKLSQKVQYFKESQKGVNEMGNVFDEYAEKRANDERKIFAAKLLEDATFAVSKIAELTGLSEQEVENLKQTIA